MKPFRLAMLPAVLALAGAAGTALAAEDCEALRTRIEQKIAASGVARFTVTVTVIDANAPANGQVVGSCELGTKKVVYLKDAGAAPAPAPASTPASAPTPKPAQGTDEPMITECKDGTVTMGNCRKQ